MPLTLDQYATYLDGRGLPWPVAPNPDPPKVKPHLPRLEGVRGILWTVYGTLVSISEGDLKFEVENDLLMNVALDKTIHEFKMWGSMSRKPGQPAEYMREIYRKALDEQRMVSSMEKAPEIAAERIWEGIIKKLFQKDYKFDAGFFGALNEYSRKVAYFFHASLQGTAGYPHAASAVRHAADRGIVQGLLADGQCFTTTQLNRALQAEDASIQLDTLIPAPLRVLSCDHKARKPSDTLFQAAIEAMGARGIEPGEILHVGSSLIRDIAPAKAWRLKTALFAGDRGSLSASSEKMKDPRNRPDALLTDLAQISDLLAD